MEGSPSAIFSWTNTRSNSLNLDEVPGPDSVVFRLEKMPFFKHLYLPMESNYDGAPVLLWTRKSYWIAPVISILYLAFIKYGPKYMEKRQAFDLRTPLKYWNLVLALYSFIGAVRVVPYLLIFIFKYGVHSTLCAPPVLSYGRGATGLWTMLFIYSKFVELIDTVFLVLRKRNLNFLHWYHHVTVLLYTWDAYVTEQPPGLYYTGMNYTVHAVMYFYYYLAAAMAKPPQWGMTVTIMQIVQMIAGVTITLVSLINSFRYPFMYFATTEIARDPAAHGTCFVFRSNMLSACAMYSTYFYLFAEFFVKRYIQKSTKGKAPKDPSITNTAKAQETNPIAAENATTLKQRKKA